MQVFKEKWSNWTAFNKIKKLWEDYKKVSHLKNDLETMKKFEAFIDSLKEHLTSKLSEKSNSDNSLEKIFGKSSEILKGVFDFLSHYGSDSNIADEASLEKFNEILLKVLEIAEHILKDSKYRKSLKDSPKLIQDFISLMERVDKRESNIFLIKIIILISENLENKIEFGKKQGFKKLFELLAQKDEKVSKLIFKALLHFLELKNEKAYNQNTALLLEELDSFTNKKQDDLSTIGGKLALIAKELRRITAGEIYRFYDSEKRERKGSERKYSITDSPRVEITNDTEKTSFLDNLPNYETILAFDLSDVQRQLYFDTQNINAVKSLESNETVKDFIVNQGAIKVICDSLADKDEELILDSLIALEKILIGDLKSQEEFEKINGYNKIQQLFLKSRNYKDEKNTNLLTGAFDFLKRLIIENNEEYKVKNISAYKVLIKIISETDNVVVLQSAVETLGFIIKKNWKNCVIFLRMEGLIHLSCAMIRVSKCKTFHPDDYTIEIVTNFITAVEFIKEEDEAKLSAILKLLDTLQAISLIMGVLNIDTEVILSEFAVCHFIQNEDLGFLFLDNLLNLIENKLPNLCLSVILIDYRFENLIKSMTSLYKLLYERSLENQDIRFFESLLRMTAIIEQILQCEHKHDILKSNDKKNSFADLIKTDSKSLYQSVEGHRDSPAKIATNNGDYKLLCKNICAESKNYLVFALVSRFRSEEPKFKTILSNLMKSTLDPKFDSRQTLYSLRILKALLIADSTLLDDFNAIGGAETLVKIMYKLIEKFPDNSIFFNNIVGILFDLLLSRNNCFGIRNHYGVRATEELPLINSKNIHYLLSAESLILKCGVGNENTEIFEVLSGILHSSDNMKIFKENGGISFIFEVMLMLGQTKSENLYDQLITIFEQLISKLQNEEIDIVFETFFHSEFLKKIQKNELSNLMVDLLGVLSIHISLNTNPVIIERITSSDHFYNVIGLLESGDAQIIEAGLKFINVLFSQKSKKGLPAKSKLVPLFIELMRNTDCFPQTLSTIYELAYSVPENVQSLFPPNSSTVSSILNRSNIADIIIKGSKEFKASKNPAITNIDFLELLFFLFGKCNDENAVANILKQFEATIEGGNIDKINESNLIVWISSYLSKQDITTAYPTKPVTECFNILTKMLYFELNKSKNSKLVELIKKIEDQEDLVFALTRTVINKIAENPTIKNDNTGFLKNLSSMFVFLEESLGMNPDIFIYVFHCINILASKNSGEIRSAMKSNKLFEFRDNILMQLIRFKLKSTNLHNIIKDFSFEAIANQSKFRESNMIAYLIEILINNPDFSVLQSLILNILKQDIAAHEENIKYIVKIIDHPVVLLYLFPNYREKSSAVIKCITSVIHCESPEADIRANLDITPETPAEEFLAYFNSDKMEYHRRAMLLKIEKILVDVKEEIAMSQKKIETKKSQRKLKATESSSKERKNIQLFISEERLKINSKYAKNLEKYQARSQVVNDNIAKIFADKK